MLIAEERESERRVISQHSTSSKGVFAERASRIPYVDWPLHSGRVRSGGGGLHLVFCLVTETPSIYISKHSDWCQNCKSIADDDRTEHLSLSMAGGVGAGSDD